MLRKKNLIVLAIVLAILSLDQVSKFYIDRVLPIHDSITVIEDFVHITHVRNTGAAFGFLANTGGYFRFLFFTVITLLVSVFIIFFLRKVRENQPLFLSSLSLILGGAIGNSLDRIRLGEVIDFVDLHWYSYHWPAFNVADSAITIGGICFLIDSLLKWGEP